MSTGRGTGITLGIILFFVGLGVGLHQNTSGDRTPPSTGDSITASAAANEYQAETDTGSSGLSAGVFAPDGFADVAERVAPAVVNVSSERVVVTRDRVYTPFGSDPFFDFFGPRVFSIPRQRRETSLGSGVIVSPDGIVLTNNHVIEGADQIQVILYDGRRFDARLLGTDPATDVAVLKVDGENLPAVPIGNSDRVRIGQVVLAFGNPFGIGQTVTMGIISAVGRSELGLVDYENFIQTDAAINPGNSGGALVDAQGRLIGINTAIFSRSGGYQGIGFAVPITIAQGVLRGILATGKIQRGTIGVSVQDLDAAMAEAFGLADRRGALINEVAEGSPAARAGLRHGDVIITYDGKPINDALELRRSVALTPVGNKVEIGFVRGGERHTMTVAVAEMETEFTYRPDSQSAQGSVLQGIVVEALDRRTSERLNLRAQTGVIVKDILSGSPAERSGLRVGDVILEMNREAVGGVEDFRRLLTKYEGGSIVLLLSRGGALYYLSLPGA
ncbi:MAG TPA: DegQ family serine endoprotease [bacterium]|nr:DegQ family serine endoprotease [bacterium]